MHYIKRSELDKHYETCEHGLAKLAIHYNESMVLTNITGSLMKVENDPNFADLPNNFTDDWLTITRAGDVPTNLAIVNRLGFEARIQIRQILS